MEDTNQSWAEKSEATLAAEERLRAVLTLVSHFAAEMA